MSDSQWLAAFAQHAWILRLNEAIAQDKEIKIDWCLPTIIDAYQVYPDNTRNLWGFPQEGDIIALFIRKDLLTNPNKRSLFQKRYHMPIPQIFEDFKNVTMRNFEKSSLSSRAPVSSGGEQRCSTAVSMISPPAHSLQFGRRQERPVFEMFRRFFVRAMMGGAAVGLRHRRSTDREGSPTWTNSYSSMTKHQETNRPPGRPLRLAPLGR
jgi:hypothetical protein